MNLKSLYLLCLAFLFSFSTQAQTWEPLGTAFPQMNNECNVLCVDTINNVLVAGGSFTNVDGIPVTRMAQWDGSSWSAMPHGGVGGEVLMMEYYDSAVWVIGNFSALGWGTVNTQHGIGRHRASGWDVPVNFSVIGASSMCTTDSLIFLMGVFNSPAERLVGIDQTTTPVYGPVQGTNSGSPMTVYNYQGTRYVGGSFTILDSNPNANHFVTFDILNAAQPVGGYGADAQVFEMTEYNGELIAAGAFNVIGGDSVTYIARWNGTNWLPLGEPADGAIRDLKVFDGKLYVAGDFDTIGGIASRRISVWNGQYWKRIAHANNNIQGVGVYDLEVYNNQLHICGDFGTINGEFIFNIARMVDSIPIAEALISDTAICAGDNILFEDRSWGPADSILFEFSGGIPATSTQLEQNVTWTTPGIHTVTHYAYNQLGVDTSTYTIYVGGPLADAGNDTLICDGTSLPLIASGGTQYTWTPSTGLSADTIANPVATPAVPTTYWVEVIDSIGCVSNDSVFVDVSTPISANFSFDNGTVSWSSALVNFQDLSTGATSWEWHFGDGQTSTDQNPSYTYQTADTFDVMLIVWNDDGCSDTFFIDDAVIVFDDSNVEELSSKVQFVASPNPADDHLSVTWDGALSNKTTIEVLDIRGRVVFSQQITSNSQSLKVNCEGWDAGTYFIKFIDENRILTSISVVVSH